MISQRQLEANRRNLAKRRKGFSPEGIERLREAALRDRPWERSTGPATPEGRARSSLNATRHGRETAQRRQFRRLALQFLVNLAARGNGPTDIDPRLLQALRTLGLDGRNRDPADSAN